jgi:cell division protease FtsH
MITVYGLSEKVGNITYYDSSGQSDYTFTKPYSEETAQLIDKEISALIETQYKRAQKILKKHKKELTVLAELLLEKEVIFGDDLIKIFGKRPFVKSPIAVSNSKKKMLSDAESKNTKKEEEE